MTIKTLSKKSAGVAGAVSFAAVQFAAVMFGASAAMAAPPPGTFTVSCTPGQPVCLCRITATGLTYGCTPAGVQP